MGINYLNTLLWMFLCLSVCWGGCHSSKKSANDLSDVRTDRIVVLLAGQIFPEKVEKSLPHYQFKKLSALSRTENSWTFSYAADQFDPLEVLKAVQALEYVEKAYFPPKPQTEVKAENL